ncbi:MAG: ribonuclease R [Gammaproteobacteria bacterium]
MNKKKTRSPYRVPHALREAQKYADPIASRELILSYLGDCPGPRVLEQIASDLAMHDGKRLEALRRRLLAMQRDGQLMRDRRGAYGVVDKMDLVRGRVVGHPDGFGFLLCEEGGPDIFLSARQMRLALHGDRVLVRILSVDRNGRREGALVEVLERANQQVVGRYVKEGGVGFVVPDNKRIHQDILIPRGQRGDARDGQIVTAAILKQPDERRQPQGRIVEVLGEHMAPGMEVEIAIRAHHLPWEWPAELEQEIENVTGEVKPGDKRGRLDLRALPLVTIDGEDARDFDDAVYCQRHGQGWRLWVAIADVSHYVRPGTALDEEAHRRGTSIYFPDRVIPMLPELLSNGLCSLNPGVDRLCLACEIEIGPKGAVKGYRFVEAVMRSAARLSYSEVATAVINKDRSARARYRKLVPHLDELYALYRALHKRRIQRGAIDFDTVETQIIFDDKGKISQIHALERNDAHRIIEECMIAANVAAASFLLRQRIPFLYRVHEPPGPEDIESVRAFLAELGVRLRGGKAPVAKDYAETLVSVTGREDEHLIQTVMLRSLKLAMYSPKNRGHFGLAFDAYTHFTSPIRRYPDLLVHRAIRHLLAGRPRGEFPYDRPHLEQLGEHCSTAERRADEATRDAIAWLKCEHMLDKIGDRYEGVISSVTTFGLFVELKNIYVEGLVHVTSLKGDYYHFDPLRRRLTGERSGVVYRLAQAVRVQVTRVNLEEKKIDLALC